MAVEFQAGYGLRKEDVNSPDRGYDDELKHQL